MLMLDYFDRIKNESIKMKSKANGKIDLPFILCKIGAFAEYLYIY